MFSGQRIWHKVCPTPNLGLLKLPTDRSTLSRKRGGIMGDARVLVVDDDRANVRLVSKLLTDAGFAVDTACDGESALELVKQNRYAVAVLDYQMPGMNGVELYQQVVDMQPDVRGIFLTAFTTL